MEKGFYHPDRGYWQATGKVPKRVLDTYPEGTIEVDLKPSALHTFSNGRWALDPAKDKADKDAKQAAKDRDTVARAAVDELRGSMSEAVFCAAIKWALKQ
jgi:hypothetical protein